MSSEIGSTPTAERLVERMFRTALESLSEAVFVVGPSGRHIAACNAAAEEMFGYGRGELIGASTEILHVDREHFLEFGRRSKAALEHGRSFHVQWEMRRRDGTVFPTSHTVSLIDEDLGLGGGAVSIVRDRSQVEELAASMEQSERRYRALFEENPEPMLVYEGGTGRILAANRALAEIWGGRPEELVGRRTDELVVEEDQGTLLRFLERARDDSERTSTWRVQHRDGRRRVLRTTSNPVVFEGQPARLVVAADITDQLDAERREKRLLSILEATPDFVGIADREENVEYINPAGRAVLGLGEEEDLRGRRIADLMTPESYELLAVQGIPAAMERGTWRGETEVVDVDGEPIPVSQVVIVHRDPAGEVDFLSTVARDMRSYRRLERQLRQAQKMEAVGRLAGGIAHDFNNLLTVLIGYADLARGRLHDPDAVRSDLEKISDAADRAEELTQQLLAYSRQQVLRMQVMDLDRVVRNTLNLLRRTLSEKIDLVADLGPEPTRVEADPSQLQQVVLNLAVNARDAMPEGGELRIETRVERLDAPRQGRGFTVPAGLYSVLRVIDQGTGIEPDLLDRVFDPFFTTKEAGQGSGLGLSTAYGIVKQSGGFIEAESEPGEGSTFTVFLPRAEGEPEPVEARRATVEPSSASGEIVLLAEDDTGVRKVIEEMLREAGYRVLAAGCGMEALQVVSDERVTPDVLVTDTVMPEMDGPELARRLREQRPDLPVLYVSGYARPTLGEHHRSGANTAFLNKPFAADDVLRTIRRLLGEKPGPESSPDSGAAG